MEVDTPPKASIRVYREKIDKRRERDKNATIFYYGGNTNWINSKYNHKTKELLHFQSPKLIKVLHLLLSSTMPLLTFLNSFLSPHAKNPLLFIGFWLCYS